MSPAPTLRATFARLWFLLRLFWASRKLRGRHSDEDRRLAHEAVAVLLRDARGLAMKAGQIWTGSGSQSEELAVVHAPSRPFQEIEVALESELGRPWRSVLEEVSAEASAASLGQVHRGVLKDGSVVAVKVRYPEIARAVRAELGLLGMLPGAGPVRRFGFDLEAYRRMLSETLSRELDYTGEADRQIRFRTSVRVPGLVVPEVHRELCSEGLLVQSWEEGVPLREAATWDLRLRVRLARTLLTTLFTSLFEAGTVHADPNPGNYLFRVEPDGGPRVVLLDYGCTVSVAPSGRLALLKLIVSTREVIPVDALAGFAAMGFDAAKLVAIADRLPALCQVLFEPFLLDRPFDSRSWDLRKRTDALLGDLKWWFRSAGPPELLLLLRAFQGLAVQLEALDVRLPWWPVLQRSVGDGVLQEARSVVFPSSVDAERRTQGEGSDLSGLARFLRVRVEDAGREVVSVTLPAAEVAHLREQIPHDVCDRIDAKGVDLDARVAQILAHGIVPQEVFELADGARRFRVWLD